jgi:hypothetical protein
VSYQNLIQDGTGKGYLARVDDRNRVRTRAVTESEFDQATLEGEAFNINTLLQTMGAGNSALFRLKNNESRSIVLVGWFIGTDGLTTTADNPLVSVYGGVTGFSGAETAVPVVNRNLGSARTFNVESFRPTTYPQTLVGAAAAPVLYQTQGASARAFGNVFITVPSGASVGIQIETTGAGAISGGKIYTGFTGYVVEAGL